jgi:predicted metalloendopeptidase
MDPHAPADFRANLVSNIDEFYTAFDVKEGDGMYIPPEKRLCMW